MDDESLVFEDEQSAYQGETARQRTARVTGSTSNNGGYFGAEPASKRTYEQEKLATEVAERLMTGKGLYRMPTESGPLTDDDRHHIQRITGAPVEDFQAKLAKELEAVAMLAVGKVKSAITENPQKLSDLNMSMAISIDKLQAVSGKAAQGAQVNVQINNYSGLSRAELMEQARRAGGREPIKVS